MNSNEAKQEGSLCVQFLSPQTAKLFRVGGPSTKSFEKEYTFDRIFSVEDTQDTVYSEFSPVVADVLMGFNTTIFAYGQTGAGTFEQVLCF